MKEPFLQIIIRETEKRFYLGIFFILALAFIVRYFYAFHLGLPFFTTDTYNYISMANAILAGNPHSGFPNGYPLIIAFVKLIFPSGSELLTLVFLNLILSTLTVGLVILITKNITSSGLVALIAGLLIALYPNHVNYTRSLLTEIPAAFFLTLSIYFLLRKSWALSGIFIVPAFLIRTTLTPVFPAFLILGWFYSSENESKKSLIHFSAGAAAAYLPFLILLLAGIIKPSSNLSSNLLIAVTSYGHQINYNLINLTPDQIQQPVKTYLQFIAESPGEYLKQRMLSLKEFWGWPSDADGDRSFIAQLLIALRIPLIIIAIGGFYKHIKKPEIWILFIPVLIVTIIHIMFFSTPRFTSLVEPLVIILAVITVHNFILNRVNNNL